MKGMILWQQSLSSLIYYVESEEKEKLVKFYQENGFSQFGKRKLDRDEVDIDGKYLIQWICYMGRKQDAAR